MTIQSASVICGHWTSQPIEMLSNPVVCRASVLPQPLAASLPSRSAESWGMSRPQKLTFAEMRSSGVRVLLIY